MVSVWKSRWGTLKATHGRSAAPANSDAVVAEWPEKKRRTSNGLPAAAAIVPTCCAATVAIRCQRATWAATRSGCGRTTPCRAISGRVCLHAQLARLLPRQSIWSPFEQGLRGDDSWRRIDRPRTDIRESRRSTSAGHRAHAHLISLTVFIGESRTSARLNAQAGTQMVAKFAGGGECSSVDLGRLDKNAGMTVGLIWKAEARSIRKTSSSLSKTFALLYLSCSRFPWRILPAVPSAARVSFVGISTFTLNS